MEESIKRVEKLIHVTNSALAQMKFSLMFDDVDGGREGSLFSGENFLVGDDLKQCQNEFNSEANEMLAKMEASFSSNKLCKKNEKAVDRIKEINKKLLGLRFDESKPGETETSRNKLSSLMKEERFTPGGGSSKESARSKRTSSSNPEKKFPEKVEPGYRKSDSLLSVAQTSSKSKEELKNKILETQEIVNRGFHTARQLAEKVETLSRQERKERTPSSGKTVSEVNVKSSGRKTESIESIATREKKRKRELEKTERRNARVIDIKRGEELEGANLQLQRLPSLHIRGGLQLQKIHSLEIPAGGDTFCGRSNTSICFLSHEQMKNEKLEEVMERVRRGSCCCDGDAPRGNFVECFNCGKLIKIRETHVDTRKLDEILEKCSFNVFDPRIDEFVEKHGIAVGGSSGGKADAQQEAGRGLPQVEPEVRSERGVTEHSKAKSKSESPKKEKHSSLRRLSDQLLRKYKQETDTIESNHLKLDSILQNLFRQVDESREIFQDCNIMRNKKEKMLRLTATEPVVVALTGTSLRMRKRQRKSDKKELTNVNVTRIKEWKGCAVKSAGMEKPQGRVSTKSESAEAKETQRRLIAPRIDESVRKVDGESLALSSSISKSWSSRQSISWKEETQRKPPEIPSTCEDIGRGPPEMRQVKAGREKAPSDTSLFSSGKSEKSGGSDGGDPGVLTKGITFLPPSVENPVSKDPVERKLVCPVPVRNAEKASSQSSSEKDEHNYESDFESMTNELEENRGECVEEKQEMNLCVNKLSTISEVDSELEKKLSDERKTLGSGGDPEVEGSCRASEVSGSRLEKWEGNPSRGKKAETTPAELVTSLRGILSALQDQFARTECLADRLTENAKAESAVPEDGGGPSSWRMPPEGKLVENLMNSRKDLGEGSKTPRVGIAGVKVASERDKKSERGFSGDSLSDEGGSSLGEIRLSDSRRKMPEKSEGGSISDSSFLKCDSTRKYQASRNSVFNLDVNMDEVLYSEGEIPSEEFTTGSEGEVLNGKNSIEKSLE